MEATQADRDRGAAEAPKGEETGDLVARYDPELRFRHLEGLTARLILAMTVILSIFHIYTAGFGVLRGKYGDTFRLRRLTGRTR